MKAYKLIRQRKDGTLAPLFINAKITIPLNKWMQSECFPTNGFAVRKGWHCTLMPSAPHLKEDLASGEHRVWIEVEVNGVEYYNRPKSQGGTWLLADKMKVLKIITKEEKENILKEKLNEF